MITSYATLKTTVDSWLNRSDLTSVSETFIQLAESKLRRDPRARKLQTRTFSVSADDASLPSDFDSLQSLYHDGSTYYGPIVTTGPEVLGRIKGDRSASGVPTHAAIVGAAMRFAPVPDTTYNLKMTYWVLLTALSDDAPTNWLLEEHPDVYLYATLLESAPYLKDDPRVATWETQLEKRLEDMHQQTHRQQFSGTMRAAPRRAIGG
jgi:hypothetical protein